MSHPHILTPSHLHTLTSSHPHILTPSHLHILTPHILTPSHPHTLTSSHPHIFTSSYAGICSGYLAFAISMCVCIHRTSSHPHILTPSPSHPHILTPSHRSLLTAIEAHYKDPSNPYPGDDNDILFELSPYLESAGFHDPLSKVNR